MRLVIARCSVDYEGRLTAHLPLATRLLMVKADGSVLVHSDGGSYKPLNWMSPPCKVVEGVSEDGTPEWLVTGKDGPDGDTLRILLEDVIHDSEHDLGIDPSAKGRIGEPPAAQARESDRPRERQERQEREKPKRNRQRRRLRNGVPVDSAEAGSSEASSDEAESASVPDETTEGAAPEGGTRKRRRRRGGRRSGGPAAPDAGDTSSS